MNDITSPLRLAIGSHEAGSGKGCAMNVISWENGDTVITDYPACSARFLARLVQGVNDSICRHTSDGLLCAKCSMIVLELGHATVGTGIYTSDQLNEWLKELIESDDWGSKKYDAAAFAAAFATTATAFAADAFAATAAAFATAAFATTAAAFAADAAAYATTADAAAYATTAAAAAYATTAAAAAAARLNHARSAIAAWHRICGTSPHIQEVDVTREAYRKMVSVA